MLVFKVFQVQELTIELNKNIIYQHLFSYLTLTTFEYTYCITDSSGYRIVTITAIL